MVIEPPLYRGYWPSVVNRLAKYSIRYMTAENGKDPNWRVTVLYEEERGLRFLAVETESDDLVSRINNVKMQADGKSGGVFYINEYKHVIVPIRSHSGNQYHYICRWDKKFKFPYRNPNNEPVTLSTCPKPEMKPNDRWDGPRPGIPYTLASGGADIYYKTPALTDTEPPMLRERMTMQVQLSRLIGSAAAARAAAPVLAVRNAQGGRFYVNEHGAMFTPVVAGDGNGIDYKFCGVIDRKDWFPEPVVPAEALSG